MDPYFFPTHKPKTSSWRLLLAAFLFSLLPSLCIFIFYPDTSNQVRLTELIFLSLASLVIITCSVYVYHLTVRHIITPRANPLRHKLYYTIVGPFLFFTLLMTEISTLQALALSVCISYIIVISLRKHLFTESLFSGLSLGIAYITVSFVSKTFHPSLIDDLWASTNSPTVSLLNLPLDQVISLSLIGLMAGPLYLACKETPQNLPGPFETSLLRPKKIVAALILGAIITPASWFIYHYTLTPQSIKAHQATTSVSLDSEIALSLSRPVNRSMVRLRIEPEAEGKWEFKNLSLQNRLFRTVVFKPHTTLKPGQKYTIFLEDARTIFNEKQESYTFEFQTELLPSIVSSSVDSKKEYIVACTPIKVRFDRPVPAYWKPDFTLTPSANIKITKNGADYTLSKDDCLEQGTSYTLNVYLKTSSETEAHAPVYTAQFQTNPAPALTDHNPKGDMVFTTTNSLDLKFTQPMSTTDTESFLSITPAVTGTWSWSEEDTKATYTVTQPLAFNTRYSILIKKGLPEKNGGYVTKDNTVSFKTIGPAGISSVVPAPGSKAIAPNTSITIKFNQDVDPRSAEEHFSLEPSIQGSFQWNGTVMTFKPNTALQYSTAYTFLVKAGVTSVHGQSMPSDYSASFTVKAAPPPPPVFMNFGTSEQGRAISGYVFGKGDNVILLFGAIHGGKEKSSALLMEKFIQDLSADTSKVSSNKKVIIIPVANPDGYLNRTDKFNSRGVNLNINFDTVGWKMYGGEHNDFAGDVPFSESESRVIRDVVSKYNVKLMVAFHATGGLVNPESGHTASQELARIYARKSGYSYFEDASWDWPGTATGWFKDATGGAAITVELRSYTVADWSTHKAALYNLVQ